MKDSLFVLTAVVALAATSARATVTISNAPTRNMVCSGGLCTPTARMAVLNAGDLESALSSGSVTITTTGSRVQASDLDVAAPISWTSASTLSLDSYRFLIVKKPISVAGNGGLSFRVNDGGSGGVLLFQRYGRATFADLASPLSIDGQTYTLVDSIASLASAVATNPSGTYALSNDYNAAPDGIYTASPVSEVFDGIFEGLGNTISHLRVHDRVELDSVGLFAELGMNGTVSGLRMSWLNLLGNTAGGVVGGGYNHGNCSGSLVNDSTSGIVDVPHGGSGGGLAGCAGTIAYSSSSASVSGSKAAFIGGLVGLIGSGEISNSFATGSVTVKIPFNTIAGGLAGGGNIGPGRIENSYATGAVTGGRADTGGLAGAASPSASYSTGAVSGTGHVGGSLGYVHGSTPINDYWDITTSGTDTGVGQGDQSGVTGLTTAQFQAGLPTGFDPAIWAQDRAINNGFPYLIYNPPP